jgi:hypothetical protein
VKPVSRNIHIFRPRNSIQAVKYALGSDLGLGDDASVIALPEEPFKPSVFECANHDDVQYTGIQCNRVDYNTSRLPAGAVPSAPTLWATRQRPILAKGKRQQGAVEALSGSWAALRA